LKEHNPEEARKRNEQTLVTSL